MKGTFVFVLLLFSSVKGKSKKFTIVKLTRFEQHQILKTLTQSGVLTELLLDLATLKKRISINHINKQHYFDNILE